MRTRAALLLRTFLTAVSMMIASLSCGANAAGANTFQVAKDAHEHPTTTSAAPTNTTSPVPLSPGARTVNIDDATFTASDGIGFALHPSRDPIAFHSTSPDLELCPADAQPSLLAIVHPSAPVAPYTCVPFDPNGNAIAVSPSEGAGHVGFVVRAAADGPQVRVDALTLQYTAIDQFFTIFPPTTNPTHLTITLTPERAKVVAAQTFFFPSRQSKGAPRITLTQGARRLRVTTRIAMLDATCYGPAVLGKAVQVRTAQPPLTGQTVGIVLQWA
jgi:hypothetical protein